MWDPRLKMISYFPTGFTKLMIANGWTAADSANGVNSVEILDIESKMSCAPFPSVPLGFRGGSGGLFDQTAPWVCSGAPTNSQCFLYKNGAWSQTGTFLSPRTHFSVVSGSPFGNPIHKFYVVAGNTPFTGEAFDGNKFSEVGPSVPFKFYVSCMVYLNATTVMLIAGWQGDTTYSPSTYVMNAKILAWQQGPTINVGRLGHGCGRIVQGVASEKYSTIIAGGTNGGLLNQVEILDDGAISWRYGPSLPVATNGAPMVEDQRGGVLYVGGDKSGYSNSIYRLRHAGAQWESLASTIATPRVWHSAFLVPDELVNCQPE